MSTLHHYPTASVPLLCLLPVLSSTATVTFTFTEYWTLIPFLQTSIPAQSLSSFWKSYLYTTIPGWVGFGLLSASTGFPGWRNTTGITRGLYGRGKVLALGHYGFGFSVAKIIERIVYGPPEKAKRELKTWLKLHTARMILVDIPAMACLSVASST